MMNKLISALKGTPLIPVIVLAIAALIVWRFGSRFGLSYSLKITIAISLLVIAGVVWLIWWLMERRRSKGFVDGMSQETEQEMSRVSEGRRAELEDLLVKWKDAVAMFKQATRRSGDVLRRLPWFVIIGEPQSGKSTLLKNSGLDFPIGDAAVAGIGGTKNCDWWFGNEAVILDTAGRYTFEVDSAPDRTEWKRFLDLLRKTRKRQAINGLMVVLPTDALLKMGDDELRQYAQHVRAKINEMMGEMGTVFPVYVVITKVDLVEGFVDFFERFPADKIREAVGRTASTTQSTQAVKEVNETLESLYDRLGLMSLQMMKDQDPGDGAAAYILFPEEYRSLAERIKTLVQDLFRTNIYMENPFFRGLYLTSGTQEGTTIASSMGQMAENLGLDPSLFSTEHAEDRPKRAFFVRDLLSGIMIGDSNRDLVRPMEGGQRNEMMRTIWRVIVPSTCAALLLLVWSFLGYRSNRAAWQEVRTLVQTDLVSEEARGAPAEIALALENMARLEEAHAGAVERSSLGSLFMSRGEPDPARFGSLYRERAESQLIEPMLDRFEARLKQSPRNLGEYLELLEPLVAYQRAVEKETPGDTAALEGLARAWNDDRSGRRIGELQAEMARVVSRYIEEGGHATRPEALERAASKIRSRLKDLGELSPVEQLASLSRRIDAASEQDRDIYQLERWLEDLEEVSRAGPGSLKIEPDLPQRIISDAEETIDAQPVIPPLTNLVALLEQQDQEDPNVSDPMEDYEETIGTPLRAALSVEAPDCPMPMADDPETSVLDAAAELQNHSEKIGAELEIAEEGINAFNRKYSDLYQPIKARSIQRALLEAKVSPFFAECTSGWLEQDGLLSYRSIREALGSGGGAAGQDSLIVAYGEGLFYCAIRHSGGGGASVDEKDLDAVTSAIREMVRTPGVARTQSVAFERQWRDIKESLEGAGGGRTDWSSALRRVKVDSPPGTWTLDQVPGKLEKAPSLTTCLNAIKNGLLETGNRGDLARINNFNDGAYTAALMEIGTAVDEALQAGESGISNLVSTMRSRGSRSPFEVAKSTAVSAPSEIRGTLQQVPEEIWSLLAGRSQVEASALYEGEIRDRLAGIQDCYPFDPSGPACSEDESSEVMGLGSPLARLRPLLERGVADFGPLTTSYLDRALAIQRFYTSGGQDGAMNLTFQVQQPEILRAENVPAKDFNLMVETATLTLAGDPSLSIAGDEEPKQAEVILTPQDVGSNLDVKLKMSRERGAMEKMMPGGEILPDKVVVEVPDATSGSWSALRLLETGSAGGRCCTWDLPIYKVDKKGKKEKQVGTVHLVFLLRDPSEAITSPEFWSLGDLPRSLDE